MLFERWIVAACMAAQWIAPPFAVDRSAEWYRSPEGRQVAANVLSYQSDRGSWPKNLNTFARSYTGPRSQLRGTFDNGATIRELRFLASAYRATNDERDREALLKGLDHILQAQYPSGGWPQFYPPGPMYHRHITFNDGTMVNILEFLRDVAQADTFAFVDESRRADAQRSFDAGIRCILENQIPVHGELTVWCAQHDETTLEPRQGRAFEPPSLSGSESAGILSLLMSLDRPSPEVRRAIHAGARWFDQAKLLGIRQVYFLGDKRIVPDEKAPPLWARFYEIGTNRPIFCGRDGVIHYDIAEIDPERRNHYVWYGRWGSDVAARYALWKARWDPAPDAEQSH